VPAASLAYLASVAHPPGSTRVLSRELSEFLIELSIALHKHAMYPDGHPSLAPAALGVVRRGDELLQDRPSLSLGVARSQLIIEGVATDARNPVLRELAGRLHRHHLGAVTFSRGLEVAEIQDLFRLLAVEADRSGQPLGLADQARLSAWPHIRLHRMTYDRLELVGDASTPPPEGEAVGEGGGRDARARGAQLWIGLARAALAGRLAEDDPTPTKPAVIAQAIDEHPKSEAYDQVIVGYLLQIADELKSAGGLEAVELRRRTSRLVAELRPETMRRLIEMGGDVAQRRQFVLDASHGMAVDAVVDIMRAAADASRQPLSNALLRMLSKLAAHAGQGAPRARPVADTALRDQVRSLLTGWDLADPNPAPYAQALQGLSQAGPGAASSEAPSSLRRAEPERVVQMSLEVEALGPVVWQACAELMEQDRLSSLMDLLEQAATDSPVATELWARAASEDTLRWLLGMAPVEFSLVDRVMRRLGTRAAEPLLDALAEADARSTRRALLDRLVRLGSSLGPSITARLSDERWYVLRNLLSLLDELPTLPEGFSAMDWIVHRDARVRLEALKVGLKSPTDRPSVIIRALADSEQRIVRLALMAAREDVPPEAVPRVIALGRNREASSELRILAIRVLGGARSEAALEALLAIADGGRSLFGRRRLPAKTPELIAAVGALASGWAGEVRAGEVLALAALSEDAELRAATDPRSASA
jgi:hypothetical protein